MLSKKGDLAANETFGFIFSIITLALLAVIIIGFFGENDVFADITCKTSVYFAAQTHGVFPAICYTKDFVSSTTEDDKVMKEMAESMRSCWSQWGEGDADPEGKRIFFDEQFKCFVCERMKWDSFEGTISAERFTDYLKDTDNDVRGTKKTYAGYFKNNYAYGFKNVAELDSMVKKDEEYAVVFVEDIETNIWARYGVGLVQGAAAGGVICLVIPGPGWAATPGCLAVGAAANTLKLLAQDTANAFDEWIKDKPDQDAIMFSKYDEVPYCGGYFK